MARLSSSFLLGKGLLPVIKQITTLTRTEFVCDILGHVCGVIEVAKNINDSHDIFYTDDKGRCVSCTAAKTTLPKVFHHKPWLTALLDCIDDPRKASPKQCQEFYNGNVWVIRCYSENDFDIFDWGITQDDKLRTIQQAAEEVERLCKRAVPVFNEARERKYHLIQNGKYIKSLSYGLNVYKLELPYINL